MDGSDFGNSDSIYQNVHPVNVMVYGGGLLVFIFNWYVNKFHFAIFFISHMKIVQQATLSLSAYVSIE